MLIVAGSGGDRREFPNHRVAPSAIMIYAPRLTAAPNADIALGQHESHSDTERSFLCLVSSFKHWHWPCAPHF